MAPSELSANTILVTGGAGFIGSHLVDSLFPANTVRILDNFSTGTRSRVPDEVTVYETNLQDTATLREAMADVDIVFHLGAMVSVDGSIDDPAKSHTVNVDATRLILEYARTEGAKIIYASSAAIYGDPDTEPIPESLTKTPTSPYGLDKLTADHYCRLYADLYDVDVVALRYFNVYGEHQPNGQYSGVINTFFRQALAGDPITVHGDGTQTRDFVHVADVVQANHLAVNRGVPGEAYNIATGQSTSINDLAHLIKDLVDSQSEIIHTDPRPGDIQQSRADISKAKTDLNYSPTISVSEGLQSVQDWLAKRHP